MGEEMGKRQRGEQTKDAETYRQTDRDRQKQTETESKEIVELSIRFILSVQLKHKLIDRTQTGQTDLKETN